MQEITIVICPGIHDPRITESFLTTWLSVSTYMTNRNNELSIIIYPGKGLLSLSGLHILEFLRDRLADKLKSPVVFISYSAGVVGAISAAMGWQLLGGQVTAFIAIDGWGVPLYANFPIHRLSHDYFTHVSSGLLGSGQSNFYADPPVEHLAMWRSPHTVQGYWADPPSDYSPPKKYLTVAEFLHLILQQYND